MSKAGRIKHALATLTLIAAFVTGASAQSAEKSPSEQTCALMAALVDQGAAGGNDHMAQMAAWMPEPVRTQMSHAFDKIGDKKWLRGDVFSTFAVPTYAEEYLVALETEGSGTIYIRLIYEQYDGAMRLITFSAADLFKDSMKERPYMQPPAPVDCK